MTAGESLRRVLVVDDDLSFVTFVCAALEKLNVRPEVSPTGSDAVRQLASGRWSGVLLDLRLPDIDGLEILRSLRQRGDFVPVVVLTGAGSIPAAVEATKLGAVDFLEKPVRLPVLARAVEQLLTSASHGSSVPVDDHGWVMKPRTPACHRVGRTGSDRCCVCAGGHADSGSLG